jgi:DNA repair exonuclease SbcCD ATPase subunit
MQSDPIHAVEGVAQRVRALRQTSTKLTTLRDSLAGDLESKEREVGELTKRIELLAKVHELFRVLMDLMIVKQVRMVEDVVTEGLQTIFYDLELSCEADVGPKWGKISVEFFFRQGDKDNPLSYRGKPMQSFGGGPSSIASLVLRLLTVLRLKLWPVLVLDEALGAVSEQYVEHTGVFLERLAKKMGIDVLLVTHKPAFLDHANVTYRCSEVAEAEGTRHLVLEGAK